MTSENTSASTAPKRIHPARQARVRTALTLFTVAATVTGIFLLVLTTRMVLEYIVGMDMPEWATHIAQIHGAFYVLYLLSILNLAPKALWPPMKWFTTALAGTIPFFSFYMEVKRRREVQRDFQL
ncbi:DUF3817 domain-containing protein [Corynebacterium sp. 32222D000AT]|uniref:DUF3817 domain-containing protein n=1 Tax=Corynebacterium TaxID=1716 RepID=UPI0008A2E3C4|nr:MULTISPECIES: DUF3817 domain-containing protein [Corynebacterium]MDD7583030.1 DUF3817 domain-containing protein [Mycobacteriaceae bacterium]MDY5829354.1 DUF3817 domain-containing protein [Corynebacterium sp.]OFS19005.1 hypothetical protein HMPREF3067_10555 [Corynebacterium sp. HMSC04H06]WJY90376.1 hypothetical protein CCONF_09350 [Corynebacterium confusum]